MVQFLRADATIEGDSVIVSNSKVVAPKVVRYAWEEVPHPNPAKREGSPAFRFRTDGLAAATN